MTQETMVKYKDIFTKYFENNSWRGKESVSGPGSDPEQTRFLIPEFQFLISELGIKTILDLPCGDFNWMKEIDLDGIEYIGGDIVQKIIENNNQKYASKNIKFELMDVLVDNLPTVDLVVTRDCFVHFPNEEVIKAIKNIKASKSKYLLTTNFTWRHKDFNRNIGMGGWHRLNFECSPFNFPIPKRIIIEGNIQSSDHHQHRDKTMSLWELEFINL